MKTILVVDDEKDIREAILNGLKRNNYAPVGAENGAVAVKTAQEQTFDLVLLDIAMPGMDGYATCAQLRALPEYKTTPVVFLTGKDLDPRGVGLRLEELGAKGYLPKPSTLQDLLNKVNEVIGPPDK